MGPRGRGKYDSRNAPFRKGRLRAVMPCLLFGAILAVTAWICRDAINDRFEFWATFESLGRNVYGYAEYRHRETCIEFVKLPGGTFVMGSSGDERERFDNERQPHKRWLRPFLIAKHEVTQAQWREVMGTCRSHYKGADRPVETVSWEECRAYCQKTGLRLPTEAEWEYACRAGSSGEFCFGDEEARLGEFAWYAENAGGEHHPVAAKKPNDLGLYDMHGNVAEWCEGLFNEDGGAKRDVIARDDGCPPGSERRAVRGGFYGSASDCRSAGRIGLRAGRREDFLGFRPVWSTQ